MSAKNLGSDTGGMKHLDVHHKSARVDLTQGSIIGRSVLFALPICGGNILQLLYTTVDTLVIGNFGNRNALAGIATSTQPLEILLCVFLGIGGGISVLVSHAVGARDEARIKTLVKTSVWFLFVSSIPLTVIGIALGPLILKAMQVSPDAMHDAVMYLRITTLGILGNMGYNFNAGLLRGLGNSTSTLWMLGVCCAVNVVLDLLFVAVFHWGAAGAAAATAIALFLSWFFSIIYIRRNYSQVQLPLLPKGYDRAVLKEVLRIGLPMGMNSALYSFGHLFLQAVYNMQGTVFVAGCSIAGKVNNIASITIVSFSQAASVFSGQNFGARHYRRIKRGAWQIPLTAGLVTFVAGVIVLLFCRPIMMGFTRDEEVIEFAVRFTRVVLPFQWNYAVLNVIMHFGNGLGHVKYPTTVSLLMLWVIRIPSAYILSWLGYGEWAMASVSLSFFVGMIAMFFYFCTKSWRKVSAMADSEPEIQDA